jgi:WD40 repeat protein
LDDSQLLLWSDGYEINIYSPKDHRTEFITRQSETINQVRFWPDGNTILFTSQDKLLAIDRYKNGDERYLVTLITADSLHNFFLSSDGKTAYLEATIEGTDGFYSLRLR